MRTPFHLDAYLERIGYGGPHAATLEVLRAITARHTRTIPFENMTPWLRRPVRLDVESLQRKLVGAGRGGYCFEQNLLMDHALRSLGFQVTGLAARVLWNTPKGTVTPRGHMLLLVSPAGQDVPSIVDVGFGVLTPTAPLRLEPGPEQITPHEPFRLTASGGDFTLEGRMGDLWKPLYRFDLQEQLLPDYEVTNWYLSNHPDSRFVTGLLAARPDRGCRYTLQDTDFAVRYLDGRVERRALRTVVELRHTLEHTFRVAVPAETEVDAALEWLAARPA